MDANRLRALKNVSASWLGLGATFLAGFFLTPVVLRHVGDTAFGIWILLTTVTGYYGLLDLGLRTATIRFVARSAELNDRAELNQVVSTSFFFYLLTACAMAAVTGLILALFDVLFRVSPEWQHTGRVILVLVGFGTALTTPLTFFTSVLEGLQKFSVTGIAQTVTVLVRTALVLAGLRQGYKIVGVAAITIGLNFVSAAVLTVMAFRVWPALRVRWRDARLSQFRKLLSYGGVGIWISVAQSIRFQFDSVVIGRMISAEAITLFSFGSRLSVYSIDVLQMMAQIFMPMASAADASGSNDRQRRLFIMSNRYSALIALPLGVIFLAIGGTIIRVWVGPAYVPAGYAVLSILTIPMTIHLMQAGSPKLLLGMARHRPLAVVLGIEAVANLALSIALVPRFGILGVAWGTAIPLAITNIFFLPGHMCRLLGVKLSDFLFESYWFPVLAAIPLAATLFLADRRIHASGWIGLIEVLLTAGIVYAGELWVYFRYVEHRPVPAMFRVAQQSGT
jgi:O-antigen/teichoic acid export membrane protein